jgi:2-hydroxychromene-2-carboxylate isomerase
MKEANSDIAKDLLRQKTDEALTRGIFGSPSFLVDEELFWGDDRLERAIKWANDNRSH